jgi:LmbE family N-acetylglucosaminyl deacetylase
VPVNLLTEIAQQGLLLIVLSPHLDDAVLSCGELIIQAAERTETIVATLFTEAGPPPHTLSARRYLRQVGAPDAEKHYRQRRSEDRTALESAGVASVMHAGLIDAPYRRRAVTGHRRRWARLLPELEHVYPVYRLHVMSGCIAPSDSETLRDACRFVQRLADRGPALVLAPLGVGGHVDHVLARSAAERSGVPVIYYSDFPYNQHHQADGSFIRRNGLVEAQSVQPTEAKAALIRAYRTQARALFPGNRIPLAPEVFFCPASLTVPNGGMGDGD